MKHILLFFVFTAFNISCSEGEQNYEEYSLGVIVDPVKVEFQDYINTIDIIKNSIKYNNRNSNIHFNAEYSPTWVDTNELIVIVNEMISDGIKYFITGLSEVEMIAVNGIIASNNIFIMNSGRYHQENTFDDTFFNMTPSLNHEADALVYELEKKSKKYIVVVYEENSTNIAQVANLQSLLQNKSIYAQWTIPYTLDTDLNWIHQEMSSFILDAQNIIGSFDDVAVLFLEGSRNRDILTHYSSINNWGEPSYFLPAINFIHPDFLTLSNRTFIDSTRPILYQYANNMSNVNALQFITEDLTYDFKHYTPFPVLLFFDMIQNIKEGISKGNESPTKMKKFSLNRIELEESFSKILYFNHLENRDEGSYYFEEIFIINDSLKKNLDIYYFGQSN